MLVVVVCVLGKREGREGGGCITMMRSWIYDQRQGDDAWVGAEPNPLFNPFQHNQSGDYMLHVQHDAAGHVNDLPVVISTRLTQPKPWPRALIPLLTFFLPRFMLRLLCSEDDDKKRLW